MISISSLDAHSVCTCAYETHGVFLLGHGTASFPGISLIGSRREKCDRFVVLNVRVAQRQVYSDLRIQCIIEFFIRIKIHIICTYVAP